MRKIRSLLALLLSGLLASSCSEGFEDRVLTIEGTGIVSGLVYLDLNGDSILGAGDGRVEGLAISVGFPGAAASAAVDTTGAGGVFSIGGVPAGRLEFRVDSGFLGDSLRIVELDSALFTLPASDTVNLVVGVAYPGYSVPEARNLTNGTALFLSGTVLTPRSALASGTVFIRGNGRALRITQVPLAALTPGDSIRIRGHISTASGQPTVVASALFTLVGSGTPPTATPLSTFAASHAQNGSLDADLVQVANAAVVDTATVAGTFVATVNDGSGVVEVHLQTGLGFPTSSIRPGTSTLTLARGTLIPTSPTQGGSPRWALLPRIQSDLAVTASAPAPAE